ncbi:Cytochrome b-c1 complex subunit 10 [Manis javanica]|nr:Cytochrome b-c1 complex subunit 10 [Manis javanica]
MLSRFLGPRYRELAKNWVPTVSMWGAVGTVGLTLLEPLVSAGAPSFHLGTHCRWNSPSPRDGPQGNPQRD